MQDTANQHAGTGQSSQQNCIFCHIINGKVESKKVYSDEDTIGILDINPANPGHVLILPKKHYSIMPQMNDLEIGHIFMVSKHISGALLKALKAEGTNIFVANGAVAGQKAPHFMVHVIPRREGDNLNMVLPEYTASPSDLIKVREMLLPRIKEHLGLSEEDIEKLSGAAADKTQSLMPDELMNMPSDAAKNPALPVQGVSDKAVTVGPNKQAKGITLDGNREEVLKKTDLDLIAGLFGKGKAALPAASADKTGMHMPAAKDNSENNACAYDENNKRKDDHDKEKKDGKKDSEKGKPGKITLDDIDNLFNNK
ncbi:HIT domain-containing protein [Candidatus Woesearchaeota archaeon]|nr:HIT domain-containing protein [Candidatus Woesearchaeota archaeon]